MRRIDELRLQHPFASARMPARNLLGQEGPHVGRKRMASLMGDVGLTLDRDNHYTSNVVVKHSLARTILVRRTV